MAMITAKAAHDGWPEWKRVSATSERWSAAYGYAVSLFICGFIPGFPPSIALR